MGIQIKYHKLKRLLLLSFVLCLFIATSHADSPITPTEEDLPLEDAITIAKDVLASQFEPYPHFFESLDVSCHLWTVDIIVDEVMAQRAREMGHPDAFSRYWIVFFYAPDFEPAQDIDKLVVQVSSPDGTVMMLSAVERVKDYANMLSNKKKDDEIKEITAMAEVENGPWYFWSYQEKAAFYQQYGFAPGGLSIAKMMLPSETDICYEDALAIAKNAFDASPYGKSKSFDDYLLDCSFGPFLYDSKEDRFHNGWVFCLREPPNQIDTPFPLIYQVDVSSPERDITIWDNSDGKG